MLDIPAKVCIMGASPRGKETNNQPTLHTMSKTNQAKSIIHPSFFLTVDTSYGTNDSTITIVPNCADKDCKRYVMHFNKNTEKFRNKGIKESKAAFDEFVQLLKN